MPCAKIWRQFERAWMLDVGVVKTRKLILERCRLKSRDVACACRRCGVRERGPLSLLRLARTLFNVDLPRSCKTSASSTHPQKSRELRSRPQSLKLFSIPHWLQCLRVPSTSALLESTPHQDTGGTTACCKKAPTRGTAHPAL
jgi:hypothetical protein